MRIKTKLLFILSALALVAAPLLSCPTAFAEDGLSGGGGSFSVSPMNQELILNAGEITNGTMMIANPAANTIDFNYEIVVEPFYVTDEESYVFENNGDYTQIVNWITIDELTGTLAPNETKTVHFSINTPSNAPAGGQYASLTVRSLSSNGTDGGINLQQNFAISHILYAEVAGTTVRQGEILEASVPSFLFGGKIGGTSRIKNTGNVHSHAKYTIQVFPLFSDEEVFTNEEHPTDRIIYPGITRQETTYWGDTPSMGIFNVVYTAEFEGVTSQVKKMVIVCPLWLLLTILAVIAFIIISIIYKVKKDKR